MYKYYLKAIYLLCSTMYDYGSKNRGTRFVGTYLSNSKIILRKNISNIKGYLSGSLSNTEKLLSVSGAVLYQSICTAMVLPLNWHEIDVWMPSVKNELTGLSNRSGNRFRLMLYVCYNFNFTCKNFLSTSHSIVH